MAKTLLVAFVLICQWATALAQEPFAPASRVGLSIGSAAPLAKFRSSDFREELPPFAGSGSIATLTYIRSMKPFMAMGGTAGWRRNPFLLDKFVAEDDEPINQKEAKPWQSFVTMADLYLQAGAHGMTAYLRGSAGAAFNRSASLYLQTDFGDIRRSAANATSFAYDFGVGLHKDVGLIGVGLEASLLSTNPTFEVQDAQQRTIRYSQAMHSLNFSLGLTYKL